MSEKTRTNALEALVSFYRGEGRTVPSPDSFDDRGYTLDDILEFWQDEELEHIHDYIQWLFPLTEKSRFNPVAPVLDRDRIETFRSDDLLQANLIAAFKRMLAFYGFECEDVGETVNIRRAHDYPEKAQEWLTHHNHNYLRITRILKSLRLLGCDRYAEAFFDILAQIYRENDEIVGGETFRYWQRAVGKDDRRTRRRSDKT